MYIHTHIYIYIYIYIHTHTYMHIYIYIYRHAYIARARRMHAGSTLMALKTSREGVDVERPLLRIHAADYISSQSQASD